MFVLKMFSETGGSESIGTNIDQRDARLFRVG
jgi:hypothetical protein